MKTSRFTHSQIIADLEEAEARTRTLSKFH